ncbi:transcriptional regulator [Streptomyces sp. NBC_00704]|uniref:transcriptional regulator n=1 Tax=Streptomyces sp. NBC_00704 TaxID=2975809 RepID=UPI002E33AFF6|nr:transcriptional regulator [Streptomyces sp. NBC_00704]
MTAVRTHPQGTTPPPRLPVREKSGARDRGGALSPMLTRLAAERATGVLERERGSLYLAEGRVVHAESPLAPGLDVLLLAHGTLAPAVWQDAVDRADEEYGAARLLLDAGRVPRGALELCHLEAVYDAAYFALAPSSTPGHFRYGAGHWLGALRPVPVAAVERETLRRRELLDRLWPDPLTDGAPLRRADAVAAPTPTARQGAVLALADGVRTAPDIARKLGRQAFHTLVDVRRLAAAGLLTALFPPPRAPKSPAAAGPGLPPRHALAATAATAAAEPPRGITLPRVNDPDITLLKRLRDALEAL